LLSKAHDPRLDGLLFPKSPMEVVEEGSEWHIWIEGQWHAKVTELERFPTRVSEIEERLLNDFSKTHCVVSTSKSKKPRKIKVEYVKEDVLFSQLRKLIALHGEDWFHPNMRMNPEWPKWSRIQKFDLVSLFNEETERRVPKKRSENKSAA
jgi:hypothetical protein